MADYLALGQDSYLVNCNATKDIFLAVPGPGLGFSYLVSDNLGVASPSTPISVMAPVGASNKTQITTPFGNARFTWNGNTYALEEPGTPALQPETGLSTKLSEFPNPAAPGMEPGAFLAGIDFSGENAKYSQAQILTGISATDSSAAGPMIVAGGAGSGSLFAGGAAGVLGGAGDAAAGGAASVIGGPSVSGTGGAAIVQAGDGPMGGGVAIRSGAGSGGGGAAGNITITIGQGSGGATNGQLIILNLPTDSTSLDTGAIYSAAGTLKVK